jgi:hypothetical protein
MPLSVGREPVLEPITILDATGGGFSASGEPGLWIDQGAGKLYVYATRASDQTGGVVCVDLNNGRSRPEPILRLHCVDISRR